MKLNEVETIIFNRSYDTKCPVCNKCFDKKIGVATHIYVVHNEYIKKINEAKIIFEEKRKKETITCPICNLEKRDLTNHIRRIHKIEINEFKTKFPLTPLVVLYKNKNIKCEKCNLVFSSNFLLGKHIKDVHNISKIKSDEKHFVCKICNNTYNDIKQHIESKHKIEWKDYCKNNLHNIKETKFVSKNYKENLSKNKILFYNSDAGKELKKIQSFNMIGDKNMSKKEEIRQKITISALKRIENNPFFLNSFGIYFNFIYDNKKYFCRSFEELKVMYMLLKNNISFEYEKLKIKYLNDKNTNKTYISDFYINNTYYEIKSSLKNFFNLDRNKKYIYIQKMFKNKNIKFEITTPEILFKQLNLNINLEELYLFCKNLLENDLMNISFVTYTNNSRVLKKITSDYKNHKNIKIKFKRNENV